MISTAPTPTARFGDIFEADWLFDVAIENDAVRLKSYQLPTRSGGGLGYRQGTTGEDFLLAHGEPFRLCVLVSDDCHAETVCVRAGRGRLLFAPLIPFGTEDERVAATEETKQHFGRLAVEPTGVCPNGGMIELRRHFAVRLGSPTDVDAALEMSKDRLSDSDRIRLQAKWDANAVRIGPVVAADSAQKLASLTPNSPAQHVAAQALAKALALCWRHERTVEDLVDDAFEAGESVTAVAPKVVESLTAMRNACGVAIDEVAKL